MQKKRWCPPIPSFLCDGHLPKCDPSALLLLSLWNWLRMFDVRRFRTSIAHYHEPTRNGGENKWWKPPNTGAQPWTPSSSGTPNSLPHSCRKRNSIGNDGYGSDRSSFGSSAINKSQKQILPHGRLHFGRDAHHPNACAMNVFRVYQCRDTINATACEGCDAHRTPIFEIRISAKESLVPPWPSRVPHVGQSP